MAHQDETRMGEDQESGEPRGPRKTDRRTFVKGAAIAGAGLAGGVRLSEAEAQEAPRDPEAPPGLGPNAAIDNRFPVAWETPIPNAVRVLTDYFAALCRRDLEGMAEQLHFPLGTVEGVHPTVVETVDEFLDAPPASMNVVDENPERFTDHDGYLKPGAYDIFISMEILNSDPKATGLALTYDRYDQNGRRLLRCEGVYSVTNNDGKWGIQLMSTIFKPDDQVEVEYGDVIDAAKRVRVDHVLAFERSDRASEALVPQLGPNLSSGLTGGAPWSAAPNGNIMDLYRVRGITNRLQRGSTTQEELDSLETHPDPPNDPRYANYRELFPQAGVGNWGFIVAVYTDTRVIHHNYHKAHLFSGAARYTVAGELASRTDNVEVITYINGRWGRATANSGLTYTTRHDRSNDVRPGPGGPGPQGIG